MVPSTAGATEDRNCRIGFDCIEKSIGRVGVVSNDCGKAGHRPVLRNDSTEGRAEKAGGQETTAASPGRTPSGVKSRCRDDPASIPGTPLLLRSAPALQPE